MADAFLQLAEGDASLVFLCAGASHLLEYLAFKSTAHRTHLRLVREVEVIGANVLASASREQMAYNIDTTKARRGRALGWGQLGGAGGQHKEERLAG